MKHLNILIIATILLAFFSYSYAGIADTDGDLTNKANVLSVVFSLEETKAKIIDLQSKSKALVDFYTNIKDDANRAKYQAIYDNLASAIKDIDSIKAKIRNNKDNFDAIKDEIKQDIEDLKKKLLGANTSDSPSPSVVDDDGAAEFTIDTPDPVINGGVVTIRATASSGNGIYAIYIYEGPAYGQNPPLVQTCYLSSCSYTTGLNQGDYVYYATAKDNSGNEKRSEDKRFTIGSTATTTIDLATNKKEYTVGESIKLTGDSQTNSITGNLVAKAVKNNPVTGYATGQSVSVTGTLEVLHYDDFASGTSRNEYYINTGTERLKIEQPSDMPQLLSGSTVKIQGSRIGKTVSAATTGNIQVIQSVTPGVSGEQKVLVILAEFEGESIPFDKNKARDIVFNRVNEFYKRNSYGKISLSGDVIGPIVVKSGKTDDFYKFTIDALEEASRQVNLHDYQRIIIGSNFCCFAFVNELYLPTPQGTIRASVAWTGQMNYDGAIGIVAHEMGHEFGLFHANRLASCDLKNTDANACNSFEYGDYFDKMGSRSSEYFNAPHREILGWLSTNDIITSPNGAYTISPLEISSNSPKAVKIPVEGKEYYYYLEYRKDLSGVLIHAAPIYLAGNGGGGDTHLVPVDNAYAAENDYVLKEGKEFSDKNDIQIGVSSINSDSALVEINHNTKDAPDLVVDMSTAYYNRNINVDVGEDITVNPVVSNIGLKESSSSILRLYLSDKCEQGKKPSVITLLKEVPAGAIKSRESKKFDFTIPIGNYFTGFRYLVSDIESQDDYNKQNNFDCIPLVVDPTKKNPYVVYGTISETAPRYVKLYFAVGSVHDYEGFELWRADGSNVLDSDYRLLKSVGVTGIIIDDTVKTSSDYTYKIRGFKTINDNKIYSDFRNSYSIYISPVIPSFVSDLAEYKIFTGDGQDIKFIKIKIMAVDEDVEIKDITVHLLANSGSLLNLRVYDGNNKIGEIDTNIYSSLKVITLDKPLIIKAKTSHIIDFVADIDPMNYGTAKLGVISFNTESIPALTYNLPIYGYYIRFFKPNLNSPDNLVASQIIFSKPVIEIKWNNRPSNGVGYEVWRSMDQEDNYQILATVSADKEMATDITVEPNHRYYYRVRAFKGKSYSDFSNLASIDVLPASAIKNNIGVGLTGFITMKIQKGADDKWTDYMTILDDTATKTARVIPANGVLDLDKIWNPNDVKTNQGGKYRAYVSFTSVTNQKTEAVYEFQVI
ncbi:hypothetical protein HYZ41_03875 [archaeon]|nr:hypothetical protein [archaeon]